MKAFLDDNFLLTNKPSERLYHEFAKDLPIYDYHCHLSPKDIAENRRFDNIAQLWFESDHYKWRAMRTFGLDEAYVTGAATDREKYDQWAKVVPQCVGNPIFHWTHMELKRPFGIEKLFNEKNAEAIWAASMEKLSQPEFSAQGILRQMNVAFIGTTDDPLDDLRYHQAIEKNTQFSIDVSPTWRPDKLLNIDHEGFSAYITSLAEISQKEIISFEDLLSAIEVRLDVFSAHNCRSADHGLEVLRFASPPSSQCLDAILIKGRQGEVIEEHEIAQYATALQIWLAEQYQKRGWVMQMHIGAQRNNNSRMLNSIGRDTGFDSLSDRPYSAVLAQLLNAMDVDDHLPKTILYGLNPSSNEMLATMAGNFQHSGIVGKVQYGAAWWFNDQKDGIERHLEQLSQLSVLSTFVGMLTDSRSFLSYIRHEYFRRILCNKLGRWVVNGEVPYDLPLLSGVIEKVCYYNAHRFFSNGRSDER